MAGTNTNIDSALEELYKALSEPTDEAKVLGNNGGNISMSEGEDEGGGVADDEEGDMEKSTASDDEDDDQDDDQSDDQDDDQSDDESDDQSGDEDDDMDKSLTEGDDDMEKALAANPVLARLVDGIDDAFGGLQEAIAKSMSDQENVNDALVKGMASTLTLVKGLHATIDAQNQRIDSLTDALEKALGQPQGRKAASAGNPNPRKGQDGVGVLAKSVAGQHEGGQHDATYGMHPSVLHGKLLKGLQLAMQGDLTCKSLSVEHAQAFDRTGTVPEAVFQVIKDL